MKHINIPDNYIRRKTSTIDFGYEKSEIEGYLKPIPSELSLLKKAKLKLKNGDSTRKVAEWLSNRSNRYISHVGLWKQTTNLCTTCKVVLTDDNWNESWKKTNRKQCKNCNNPNRKKYNPKSNPNRMFVNGKYIPKSHPLYKAGNYKTFEEAAFSSLSRYTSSTEGEVYIITNPAWEGWIKIGMAIDAKDRCKAYQTSSPMRDYKLEYKKHFNDRRNAEHTAHYLCSKKSKSKKGEWFQLDIDVAIQCIEEINIDKKND